MVRRPIQYGMRYSATEQFVSTTALHLRRGFCTFCFSLVRLLATGFKPNYIALKINLGPCSYAYPAQAVTPISSTVYASPITRVFGTINLQHLMLPYITKLSKFEHVDATRVSHTLGPCASSRVSIGLAKRVCWKRVLRDQSRLD